MKAIINVNVVLLERIIIDGTILIENGRVIEFGEAENITIPLGTEQIDACGNYAGPGFVDIHTHAGKGVWFYENPEEAASYHLAHGTTSLLPALYFNLTSDEYISAIEKIKTASIEGSARIIKGLYMEGPYLNPKFGADRENNVWTDSIDRDKYIELIKKAGIFAKVWCVAPEREGIIDFVTDLRLENPTVVLSVAHSEASPAQIAELIPCGLRLATHHTNATGDLQKYPECRGVCVDEAVNYFDSIYAELICDSKGIHVDPFMLRLVVKIKGKEKIILVSDACVFNGPVPNGYTGVTDINFDFNGEIAGSKLTLDVACRNMIKHTGAGLCDIFRYASYNPARLINLEDAGCIRKGGRADIVIVDHLMHVKNVMLEGELIHL